MRIRSKKGYTLVEVMVGLGISVTLFASMVMAFLAIKSINMMARHKIQAVQVVRGQVENLKAGAFANIANATATASYDAGVDGTFGTNDDLQGTLTTTVRDMLDFDGDGNVNETQINVDNTGGNDSTAVPLQVSFAWNETTLGQSRAMTVSVDTIISQ